MNQLNFDRIFALDWTDEDKITYWRKKAQRCAEVLVPHQVDPALILGGYAVDETAARAIRAVWPQLPLDLNPNLFFY
jgi:hypothetical protein